MKEGQAIALLLGGALLSGIADPVFSFSEASLGGRTVGASASQGVAAPSRAKCDMNGDGRSNILAWYYEPHVPDSPANHNNQHVDWNITPIATATSQVSVWSGAWKVGATGDFNGDGTCDLFWENIVDDTLAVTLTAPGGVFQAPDDDDVLGRLRPDDTWVLVGSGSFTVENQADLLWWNKSWGDLMVWASAGGTFRTDPHFLAGSADTQWEAVAVADVINRSGTDIVWPDIIWRHRNSGKLVYWQMEGLDHVAGGYLQPDAVPDLGWRVVGAGDFDGDGHDDLLLQNQTSERLVVWFMDGTTKREGGFLTPSQLELDPANTCPPPEVCPTGTWTIVGPR